MSKMTIKVRESKKTEETYDRPVTLYATTRYDDAEEAQQFLDSISGGEVKVSKDRNGDTLSVSIEGADEDIDTFLAVYKDNYATLEKDCDADVTGWTDPVDLKYYTVQGRKELTGESRKKPEAKQEDILAKLKGLVGVKDAGKVLADLNDMGFTGIDSGNYVFSGNSYIVMEHPDGMYAELDYTTEPGGDVPAEAKSYDYFKDIEDYKMHHGGNAPRESRKQSEAKKNEKSTTKIETYVGFDELLGYADAEYLLEDVVDVLSKYYTYEGEGDDIVFDEDQAKDDPEFTIKIEGGDERAGFYSEDIFYVHLPNKEAAEELAKVLDGELSESKKPEAKKSEGISDMIDAKIDYNMFMRMCKTAAYLEEDEDYWDALWEYYSDLGSIGDALVFFDNLFQYTAWKDVDETYDELKDEYKDESKSKEECIEKAIDEGVLDGVYPYGDHYLWIY